MVNTAQKNNLNQISTENKINLGVSAIIVQKNKVLLIKRRDSDFWSFPGGRIEKNESIEDAVIREVKEETGLKIKIKKLSGVYLRTFWKKNILFTFLCSKISGTEKLSEETDEILWLSFSKTKRVLHPNLYIRLNDALKSNGQTVFRIQNKIPRKIAWLWLKRDLSKLFFFK